MSILFSDLDNTLIYSHHRQIGKSKIVVEHLEGKEQSFMTRFAYDFFSTAFWLSIIPVTTRTEQQYKRIECTSSLRIKYAIVCNGGKLLVDGKEDKEWSYETYIRTRDHYDSLEDATERLSVLCKKNIVHRPEKYMTYVKCCDPESVYEALISQVDPERVNIQKDERKVYLFANGITKGSAVERFRKKMKTGVVFAAGDSFMDISMLNKADYAFASPDIYEYVTSRNKIKIERDLLSDGICKYMCEMNNEQKRRSVDYD